MLSALALAGCAQDAPAPGPTAASCTSPALPAPDPAWKAERPRVRLDTSLGAIVIELDMERAPLTAGNFLNLTRAGFYDGTTFHRIVKGFVIQGGDPLSKDADPGNDGTGDPGYEIPDEFHPQLRHDAAGILSMANSGPDTGGSQFFITLAATPHLNDRHSVFGRVVEGMDIVSKIGEAATDANERPAEPIVVQQASAIDPVSFERTTGADAHVVVKDKKAEAERPVRFAVILQNTGNVRDALALGATPPAGWSCSPEAPAVVRAGTGRVVFLTLTPPAGATGTHAIGLTVAGASGALGSTSLNVTIGTFGADVTEGMKVVANYAGLLPDGRLFDTSMAAVGQDPEQPKFDTMNGWRERGGYSPFPFTVGSGVIPGFTKLAKTAKVGETVTGLIPAADAYAVGNAYERPLTGRDLVFELEIVSRG